LIFVLSCFGEGQPSDSAKNSLLGLWIPKETLNLIGKTSTTQFLVLVHSSILALEVGLLNLVVQAKTKNVAALPIPFFFLFSQA